MCGVGHTALNPEMMLGWGVRLEPYFPSVPMSISQEEVPNPPPGGPLLVVMSAKLMKVLHSFE